MKIISKRVLYDDQGKPIEAHVADDEFVRLEKIVEEAEPRDAYDRMMSAFGTVKWDEDPVEYQRRLRDE